MSTGRASHLIDNSLQVREEWLEGVETVGVTSGASAPEELVEQLVAFFRERGADGRVGASDRRRGRPLHAPQGDQDRARCSRLISSAAPRRTRPSRRSARTRRAARDGGSRDCAMTGQPVRAGGRDLDRQPRGLRPATPRASRDHRRPAQASPAAYSSVQGGSPSAATHGSDSDPPGKTSSLGTATSAPGASVGRSGASGSGRLARRRAQLLPDHGLGSLVLALAEVHPAQGAAPAPQKERRPALASVGVPRRVAGVGRDREVELEPGERGPELVGIGGERESGGVDADQRSGRGPRTAHPRPSGTAACGRWTRARRPRSGRASGPRAQIRSTGAGSGPIQARSGGKGGTAMSSASGLTTPVLSCPSRPETRRRIA